MKTAREIAQEFIDEQGPHLKGSIELLRQFGTYIRERDNRDISAKLRHAAEEMVRDSWIPWSAVEAQFGDAGDMMDDIARAAEEQTEAILLRHLEGK